jgi:hypothetical protein
LTYSIDLIKLYFFIIWIQIKETVAKVLEIKSNYIKLNRTNIKPDIIDSINNNHTKSQDLTNYYGHVWMQTCTIFYLFQQFK